MIYDKKWRNGRHRLRVTLTFGRLEKAVVPKTVQLPNHILQPRLPPRPHPVVLELHQRNRPARQRRLRSSKHQSIEPDSHVQPHIDKRVWDTSSTVGHGVLIRDRYGGVGVSALLGSNRNTKSVPRFPQSHLKGPNSNLIPRIPYRNESKAQHP